MRPRKFPNAYLIILIAIVPFVYSRMYFTGFTIADGRYLWAEDALIFASQAIKLNWFSFFQTYAGYLHTAPRIIAYLASLFPIELLPILYFIGWSLVVYYVALVVTKEMRNAGIPTVRIFLILALVFIQPHTGESFFNICNAPFFLAIAVGLSYVVQDSIQPFSANFIRAAILGTTGPYSLILYPLLLLNGLIKKDFTANKYKYISWSSVAVINLYLILTSTRVHVFDRTDLSNAFSSLYNMVTFGDIKYYSVFGLLAWGTVFYFAMLQAISFLRGTKHENGILILLSSLLLMVTTLLVSHAPLSPLGRGARYFVAVYGLFLISIPYLVHNRYFFYALIVILFTVSLHNFPLNQRERFSLNFKSYVWLAKNNKRCSVPVAPIRIRSNKQVFRIPAGYIFDKSNDKRNGLAKLYLQASDLDITHDKKSLSFTIDLPNDVKKSKHLGVALTNVNCQINATAVTSDDLSFTDCANILFPEGEKMFTAFLLKKHRYLKINIEDAGNNVAFDGVYLWYENTEVQDQSSRIR